MAWVVDGNDLRNMENTLRNKIVCIDRSPADLLRVQSILDSHFDAVLLSDPTFALKELLDTPPRILLLGTDLGGIGALSLITQISEHEPALLARSLIMAESHQQHKAQILLDEGLAGILNKPLVPDDTIAMIKALLARIKSSELAQRATDRLDRNRYVV